MLVFLGLIFSIMNRRDFLVCIVSVAALSGCGLLPSRASEIDRLFDELDALVANLPVQQRENLESLADSLHKKSSQLLADHQDFLENFNDSASDRTVSGEELEDLYEAYESQRVAQRNDILRLQDDLHAAVPAEAWTDIRDVLNRKGALVGSL